MAKISVIIDTEAETCEVKVNDTVLESFKEMNVYVYGEPQSDDREVNFAIRTCEKTADGLDVCVQYMGHANEKAKEMTEAGLAVASKFSKDIVRVEEKAILANDVLNFMKSRR